MHIFATGMLQVTGRSKHLNKSKSDVRMSGFFFFFSNLSELCALTRELLEFRTPECCLCVHSVDVLWVLAVTIEQHTRLMSNKSVM